MFDYEVLVELGSNTDAINTSLSGQTIALILSAVQLMEIRENWISITDEQWDEMSAFVSTVYSEVLSA